MKVLKLITLLMICLSMCACSNETNNSEAVQTQVETIDVEQKGTIVILATGGTIAGSGEVGNETKYTSGTISVEQLIESVPKLGEVAPIEAIQVCNVNSDDISDDVWMKLATTINEMAKDENVVGFVITHGTDTLEETAYFLNLVVKTDKPVVLTGSMRPSTSISADGPMNLYQAVSTAANPDSYGRGVLVVFSDHIFSARNVTKTSTYDLRAISGGELGTLGLIRDDEVFYYSRSDKKHTTSSEFDVTIDTKLPKVNVVYFEVDSDPSILKHAASISDGLVIAGAGAGEFSKEYIEIIDNLKIPVVISSRINEGIITQGAVLSENSVAANNLPPQKASILLKLALLNNATHEDLLRIYSEY